MYELKFTKEFKNSLVGFAQYEAEIAEIFRMLALKPYSNRIHTSKSMDRAFSSCYVSTLKKNIKVLWRYANNNSIYIVGISKLK